MVVQTPCIPSVNTPNPTHGYALQSRGGVRKYEHQWAWEEVNGPIPDGMVLDHMCHDPETCPNPGPRCPHRACRNPDHLNPVTRGQNAARGFHAQGTKTECPAGHEYDDANTYVDPRGRRHCRTCTRRFVREHKERKRASNLP